MLDQYTQNEVTKALASGRLFLASPERRAALARTLAGAISRPQVRALERIAQGERNPLQRVTYILGARKGQPVATGLTSQTLRLMMAHSLTVSRGEKGFFVVRLSALGRAVLEEAKALGK